MKLRIANKVERSDRPYRGSTRARAEAKSHRSTYNRYWRALMKKIGPAGRAHLIQNSYPAAALRLLVCGDGTFQDQLKQSRNSP